MSEEFTFVALRKLFTTLNRVVGEISYCSSVFESQLSCKNKLFNIARLKLKLATQLFALIDALPTLAFVRRKQVLLFNVNTNLSMVCKNMIGLIIVVYL